MDNIYYVYEWIRLDTNEPFYIGKGKEYRWNRKTRGNNNHFNNIVKSIPTAVNILENDLTEDEANKTECWYINKYKYEDGYNLVNITDGGEGVSGLKCSEENKKKYRTIAHGFDIEDYTNEIITLYIDNQLSIYAIAKIYKVSEQCISRFLNRHKIKKRSSKEALRLVNANTDVFHNSKYTLVKDINNNIINCFKSRTACADWLVDIELINQRKGGIKAISINIDKNKIYKGILFYNITEEQFNKIILNKDNFFKLNINDMYKQSSTYSTVIEVYNVQMELIKTFPSLLECANWLIEIGMSISFSSARDAIYRNVNNNKYYKKQYNFKQYSKDDYNIKINELICEA